MAERQGDVPVYRTASRDQLGGDSGERRLQVGRIYDDPAAHRTAGARSPGQLGAQQAACERFGNRDRRAELTQIRMQPGEIGIRLRHDAT